MSIAKIQVTYFNAENVFDNNILQILPFTQTTPGLLIFAVLVSFERRDKTYPLVNVYHVKFYGRLA